MTGIPTPGVDYEEMKEKTENGEYDSLKNGHEIYNAPNGMKINIEDQEGADLVTGGNSRDLHQEALDSNKTANQGFTSNTISDGFGNLPEVVNTETPTNTEKYVFAHDREGITAANNHIKPEETTEKEKYVFAHDRDGITAANNHNWQNGTDSVVEVQEESKEMGDNVLAHDRDGITAANNHLKQESTSQLDPESLRRQEDLRRFRDQVNVGMSESIPETTPLRPIVDLHQEVVDRKITEEAVNEAIASGTPMKVKVQRTSGEIEDDWYVLSIFTDDNGVERAKVVKTDPSSGLQLTKNIPVEDLEKLNSTEEEKPIEHFDSMMEADEAKRYENSFGQLENLKTVKDIQQEIAESIQRANTTSTQQTEQVVTPAKEVKDSTEKTDLEKEFIIAIKQITDFLNKSKDKFANDQSVQQSIQNIVVNIGSITVNIGGAESVINNVQGGETSTNTTSPQEEETPAQGGEAVNQTGTEETSTTGEEEQESTPENQKEKELITWMESLTSTLEEMKKKYADNPQIQQAIMNIVVNMGNVTAVVTNQPVVPGQGTTPSQTNSTTATTTTTTETVQGEETSATTNQSSGLEGLSLEQQLVVVNKRLAELGDIHHNQRELTDAEKIEYFDLLQRKDLLDGVEQEAQAKRDRKETTIKWIAGIAGAGLGFFTPAVGAAALIAVTFGGRLIGKGLKSWEGNLRSKAKAIAYEDRTGKSAEEIAEMDKKQKRKEWWANRLGEVSAVVIGGSTGYGLGKLAQNIFGFFKSATAPTAEASSSIGAEQPAPRPIPQGSIEAPLQGGAEVTGESVLVQNGRVNLPGSAWNGNLAQGPAQDILAGGATNHSNYAGGIYDMAASTLEKDLVSNGITRTKLFEAMDTSEVHQLLNRYVNAISGGNTQPSLQEAISSVNSTASTTLLGN